MKAIDKHGHEIFELIRKVAIHYASSKFKHNMVGASDDFVFKLRDSLWYRVDSLEWHCAYLEKIRADAETMYLNEIKSDNEIEHLQSTLRKQYADSIRKCNFDESLKEQAAVAALRFSNTTYQRTRNELHAAYPGATVSDCRAQESRSYAG